MKSGNVQMFISHSEDETRKFAKELAKNLKSDTIVALSGDLGSGKTVIVRGVCEYFDCANQVTSPTFTIVNEYYGEVPVIHCDLYRLNTIDEMTTIGLDDVFRREGVVLVEWAERALPLLPVPRIEITAAHGDNGNDRIFHFQEVCIDEPTILFAPALFEKGMS